MKNIITIITLFAIISFSNFTQAQTCDEIIEACESYLKPENTGGVTYISDGQVYQTFLDEEETAEFEATFYGGSTYRIATSAGTDDNYLIYNVYDKQRNLLFSSADYDNHAYWDFQVNSSVDVVIEAKLDLDKKASGCAVILIAFKKK